MLNRIANNTDGMIVNVEKAATAVCAFGNALGNSIVDKTTPKTSTPIATKKQSGGFDWEASESMGANNFFGADTSNFAKDLDFNPDVDYTPGSVSGDDARNSHPMKQADGSSVWESGAVTYPYISEEASPAIPLPPGPNDSPYYNKGVRPQVADQTLVAGIDLTPESRTVC